MEKATFAGGCFWCIQPVFENLKGVREVQAGYAGGTGAKPTYKDYAAKGYVEAVEITFDPTQIAYEKLLDVYWRQINPTDGGGQFVDRGPQYRPIIFYHGQEQKQLAEKSKQALQASGRFSRPIATEIRPATTFVKAEEYHQDFCAKNPAGYEAYRRMSGRDLFLDRAWGADRAAADLKAPAAAAADSKAPAAADPKAPAAAVKVPSRDELKKRLTPMQFNVTQNGGTEPAFRNAYWNNHREGIYVDIVTGKPLFSSLDKFDSACGWPSFSQPLDPASVVGRVDNSHGMVQTEVRSAVGNSHLGHVFNDGPAPTGLRYCINSASLRFIPKEDLQKEGYGQYLPLFEKKPVPEPVGGAAR